MPENKEPTLSTANPWFQKRRLPTLAGWWRGELSRRAGYSVKITAANVRELRRLGLVVTRPVWNGLSTIEVSLRGPAAR
jgi:hypothetical protein